MKKTLIFGALVAIFVFGSCSKSKECHCTITKTGYESIYNQLYTLSYDTTQTIVGGNCEDLNPYSTSTTQTTDGTNVDLIHVVECVEQSNGGSGGSGGSSGGSDVQTEYVNLGLPSGTKWKSSNETSGYARVFYTYDEAISFGYRLPTKEQFEELRRYCSWEWQSNEGFKVTGPNGNFIILPAAGKRTCSGDVNYMGEIGYYWSSTPGYNSSNSYCLYFRPNSMSMETESRCNGFAVRLVRN